MRLTDEQIHAITGPIFDLTHEKVAEAQLAKYQSYLASLTPPEVKEEVVSIISKTVIDKRFGNMPEDKANQILALVYAQFQLGENEELAVVEKVSELPEPHYPHTELDAYCWEAQQDMLKAKWVKKVRNVK